MRRSALRQGPTSERTLPHQQMHGRSELMSCPNCPSLQCQVFKFEGLPVASKQLLFDWWDCQRGPLSLQRTAAPCASQAFLPDGQPCQLWALCPEALLQASLTFPWTPSPPCQLPHGVQNSSACQMHPLHLHSTLPQCHLSCRTRPEVSTEAAAHQATAQQHSRLVHGEL